MRELLPCLHLEYETKHLLVERSTVGIPRHSLLCLTSLQKRVFLQVVISIVKVWQLKIIFASVFQFSFMDDVRVF